jgi:hypothetical protein
VNGPELAGRRAGERLPRRNRRRGMTNTLGRRQRHPSITHGGNNTNLAGRKFSSADQQIAVGWSWVVGGPVAPMTS